MKKKSNPVGSDIYFIGHTLHICLNCIFYVVLCFAGYVGCLYTFYSLCPMLIKISSATILILSILCANIYNLLFGIFLFDNVVCKIIVVSLYNFYCLIYCVSVCVHVSFSLWYITEYQPTVTVRISVFCKGCTIFMLRQLADLKGSFKFGQVVSWKPKKVSTCCSMLWQ